MNTFKLLSLLMFTSVCWADHSFNNTSSTDSSSANITLPGADVISSTIMQYKQQFIDTKYHQLLTSKTTVERLSADDREEIINALLPSHPQAATFSQNTLSSLVNLYDAEKAKQIKPILQTCPLFQWILECTYEQITCLKGTNLFDSLYIYLNHRPDLAQRAKKTVNTFNALLSSFQEIISNTLKDENLIIKDLTTFKSNIDTFFEILDSINHFQDIIVANNSLTYIYSQQTESDKILSRNTNIFKQAYCNTIDNILLMICNISASGAFAPYELAKQAAEKEIQAAIFISQQMYEKLGQYMGVAINTLTKPAAS